MQIQPTQTNFGYRHQLKTLWQSGKLPTVKKGLYGGKLTHENISLEHIKPISQGGHTVLNNLALATKEKNNKRGSDNIFKYLTYEKVREYLRQFKDVFVDGFDGNEYIEAIRNTLKDMML